MIRAAVRRCKVWYEHYHALLAAALCSRNNTQPHWLLSLILNLKPVKKNEEPTLAMAYYYDNFPNLGSKLQLMSDSTALALFNF